MEPADCRSKAEAALRAGDAERALELLGKALDACPNDPTTLLDIAECHWAAYEFEKALQAYRTAASVSNGSLDLLLRPAKRLFGLGRFSECASWIEQAAALPGWSP